MANWFAATYICNQTNVLHLKHGYAKDLKKKKWFTLINICINKVLTNLVKYSCTQIKVGFQ